VACPPHACVFPLTANNAHPHIHPYSQDLINSGDLVPAARFSKFLHASAALHALACAEFPPWFVHLPADAQAARAGATGATARHPPLTGRGGAGGDAAFPGAAANGCVKGSGDDAPFAVPPSSLDQVLEWVSGYVAAKGLDLPAGLSQGKGSSADACITIGPAPADGDAGGPARAAAAGCCGLRRGTWPRAAGRRSSGGGGAAAAALLRLRLRLRLGLLQRGWPAAGSKVGDGMSGSSNGK
jgi:hypothetical protein